MYNVKLWSSLEIKIKFENNSFFRRGAGSVGQGLSMESSLTSSYSISALVSRVVDYRMANKPQSWLALVTLNIISNKESIYV